MIFFFGFLVLCAIISSGNGQIESFGTCQNISVVGNFNIQRYSGTWHEIYRYETVFQRGGNCVSVLYTPSANGSVAVQNTMVESGTKYVVEGTAVPAPDAQGGGKLLVSFPISGNVQSDYWVLATDYLSYSLVYSCRNLPNNSKSVMSWILSRKTTLSPQAVLAIDPVMPATESLFWDNYRQTSHSERACNYW